MDSASYQVKYCPSHCQPPGWGVQPSRSANKQRWRMGPRPLPLARLFKGHSRSPMSKRLCHTRMLFRISGRSTIGHELKRAGAAQVRSTCSLLCLKFHGH
eukprot:1350860-Amphidinium_carterae.2